MNFRVLGTVSALSLLLAGAALAQSDQPGHISPAPGTSHESMSALKDSTAGAVGAISAEMTTSTRGFVQAAALSDMYEVEAGTIAVERGQTKAVRDFGQKMVDARTATTNQLKSVLARNTIDITPPASLDDRRQGMIDDLRGAKLADFDHRYLSQQEAAHKEAQILMRGYAKSGDNDAVKQFASETLPKVEDHLAMIQNMQATPSMASNR